MELPLALTERPSSRWCPHVALAHPDSCPGEWDSGRCVHICSPFGPHASPLATVRLHVDDAAPPGTLALDARVLAPVLRALRAQGLPSESLVRVRDWEAQARKPLDGARLKVVKVTGKTGDEDEKEKEAEKSLQSVDLAAAMNRRLRDMVVAPGVPLFATVLEQMIEMVMMEGQETGRICRGTEVVVVTVENEGKDGRLEREEMKPAGKVVPGLENAQQAVRLAMFAKAKKLGAVLAPHAIMVLGSHGCGKSLLFELVSQEFKGRDGIEVTSVDCTRLVLEAEGGESFKSRSDFGASAENSGLQVLIVDHIDALVASLLSKGDKISSDDPYAPKQCQSERSVTNWLCSVLETAAKDSSRLFVLGACTEATLALLPRRLSEKTSRSGFPCHVSIEPLTPTTRSSVLRSLLLEHNVTDSAEHSQELGDMLAPHTSGFVGGDLERLCRRLRNKSSQEMIMIASQMTPSEFSLLDVQNLSTTVKRENPFLFQWNGVGGYIKVKERIAQLLSWNMKHPHASNRGIILHGPTGCGKTLLVNAVAKETNASFIAVKASDITSMYLGESERLIRELFKRAQRASPCLLFLDEIDAIGSARESSGSVTNRIVGALLNEMDGVGNLQNVTVLAATNRYDSVDSALLRPGRLGSQIEVPLPDLDDRLGVLQVCTASMPLADDIDLFQFATETEGHSCAELQSLCMEAGMLALRESIEFQDLYAGELKVRREHFVLHSDLDAEQC